MVRRSVLLLVCIASSFSALPLFAAPAEQVRFFQLVASGDANRLMRDMESDLQAEIDAPVLAAWMAALNERLGRVTEIKLNGASRKLSTRGILVSTSCDITFQRGKASSELTTLNGKVIGFNVASKQMANFFQGPTSTDLYEEQAKEFINRFLAGEAQAAHDLCHKALQDVVPLPQLQEMMTVVTPKVGNPTQVSLIDTRTEITDTANKLFLDFDVIGDAGNAQCQITIEFVGLKGHLLGFNFQFK